ncbi:MAG TPA: hypothetical protein DIT10_17075 [Chryseobacterium sp.]|nr:hypothetical protein [Chryseobacterium sp.]
MCRDEIIQKGTGTIYHELGHVFGYCLANKNESTYLGEILEVSIGVKKSAVILTNSYYHYEELNKSIEEIRFNTSNKERTVAWFIEVISGCTFQAIYEEKDFNLCFGPYENQNGYADYSNVASIARYSSFHYTIDDICIMQKKYHQFILDNNVLDFLKPQINEISYMLRESNECQISFTNQQIVELVEYFNKIIDAKMLNEYLKIIDDF